jgi:methionyl aminopeptidase
MNLHERPPITILTAGEQDAMREAGRLTAECLRMVGRMVEPGVTTKALDEAVRQYCVDHKVRSAAYDYKGFPGYCCTSVNHVVAHGVPSVRPLASGDIVKVDIALRTEDGWHGDTCGTFWAGLPHVRARLITDIAEEALRIGIEAVKPGRTTGDIGHAISTYVRKAGASVVEEYGGHGIGRVFHDYPMVPNVGAPNAGTLLEPGMAFTIEPMVNAGLRYIKMLTNGAIVTRDRSWSAQFEHTVIVTDDGCEITTK